MVSSNSNLVTASLISNQETTSAFERQNAPMPLGKYTWTEPMPGYRAACYDALRAAEESKGRPAYLVEVFNAWNSPLPAMAPLFI